MNVDADICPRVLAEDFPSLIGQKVTVVGKASNFADDELALDTGKDITITVEGFDRSYVELTSQGHLEIRGTVSGERSIVFESCNPFGDNNFDLNTYNRALEVCRKEEFRSNFYP